MYRYELDQIKLAEERRFETDAFSPENALVQVLTDVLAETINVHRQRRLLAPKHTSYCFLPRSS
jgi:hypothetical protein